MDSVYRVFKRYINSSVINWIQACITFSDLHIRNCLHRRGPEIQYISSQQNVRDLKGALVSVTCKKILP